MLPDVPGNVPLPDDPHALAHLDLFVCEGVIGVAENGAVWLPASRLGERAALVLATEVIVVIAASAIVADMHAAYAAVDVSAEAFGLFLAGPSKTADIEQSLVIGAHGAKALTVFLVED
jgi:L-lactate dehydrogenase complex protein LldG